MPKTSFLAGLLLCSMLGTAGAAQAERFDVLIRGGQVADGTGRPLYRADVGVIGGRIATIGDLHDGTAAKVIDASGLVVAPGFINVHSHATAEGVVAAVNMLTQGVTTEIQNPDGFGTTEVVGQMRAMAAHGLAENIGSYIGFNAVWEKIVGKDDRKPTPDEIARMRGVVQTQLGDGAWGISAGLDYKPGYYASAEDVGHVVSVAAPWRTLFTNHDRLRPEQGYSSHEGVAETLAIARGAGLQPIVTHIKSQGAEQGQGRAMLHMLDEAKAAADVYPYLAGQTGLGALLLPGWALEGGRDGMLARLKDPAQRTRAATEAERAMKLRFGGPDGVRDVDTGRTLDQFMAEWHVGAGEALIRLMEQKDRAGILRFGSEADLVDFLRYPASVVSCDCGAFVGAKGHPRYYGSFPRVLGHYSRDEGVLTLPVAVRKMSGQPAQMLGMVDRGFLAPGMAADIAVFDPKTIADHATYEQPTARSTGMRDVLVNGVVAIESGAPSGKQGGAILLRTAHMPSRALNPGVGGSIAIEGRSGGWAVSATVTQAATAPRASGMIRVTGPIGTLSSNEVGLIQRSKGWASFTATLRDDQGAAHSLVFIADAADPTRPGAMVFQMWTDGVAAAGVASHLEIR